MYDDSSARTRSELWSVQVTNRFKRRTLTLPSPPWIEAGTGAVPAAAVTSKRAISLTRPASKVPRAAFGIAASENRPAAPPALISVSICGSYAYQVASAVVKSGMTAAPAPAVPGLKMLPTPKPPSIRVAPTLSACLRV